MILRKKTFYHVNKYLDWQAGFEFLVGSEPSPQYMALMSRDALYGPRDRPQDVYPLSYVASAFQFSKETGSLPPDFPRNVELKKGTIHSDAIKGLIDYVLITRELIFEEVRREKFPNKPSRKNGFHLIKNDKESVEFWLPKISSPEHKLYKLEVSGNAHFGEMEYLGTDSVSPHATRANAYHYWLGADKDEVSNEIMFEGHVKVLDVKEIR